MANEFAVMTTGDEMMAQPQTAVTTSFFSSLDAFQTGQRMCQLLAASSLVPRDFQGNLPNVMIALEIANRTKSSPLAVMQNLYIVQGKPSWSSQFVIAALNSCGKFSPLRFAVQGEGDSRSCYAWAIETGTGERLEGPPVSIEMARKEGWYAKAGSKWQTMPELMLRYRAAAFFGRLYAPDVLMGMQASDEIDDIAANDAMRQGRNVPVHTPTMPKKNSNGDATKPAGDAVSPENGDIESLLASAPAQRTEQKENLVAEYEQAAERYKAEIDSKTLSELQWWPGKDRARMAEELGGSTSEWYLGVMEYCKEVRKTLAAQMK